MIERKVSYFPEIDEGNTEITLNAAKKRQGSRT